MQQSNVIFACLFIAFIVFITMRGKLPAYMNALLGTNAAPAGAGAGGGSVASAAVTALGVLTSSDPVGAAATALGAPTILPKINGAASSAIRSGDGLAGAAIFGF